MNPEQESQSHNQNVLYSLEKDWEACPSGFLFPLHPSQNGKLGVAM